MNNSYTQYPLQEIFGAPSHIAILRVLNQLVAGVSGRELARRASINSRTCRLALNRLEQLNIIENLGSGKTKAFILNRKNYFANSLITPIFLIENEYLNTVIKKCQTFFDKNCIWACIYGSVAKNMDTKNSDLDILVIIASKKDDDLIQNKMVEFSSNILAEFGLSISPIIINLKQWNDDKKYQALKTNIYKDHIHLTGKRI